MMRPKYKVKVLAIATALIMSMFVTLPKQAYAENMATAKIYVLVQEYFENPMEVDLIDTANESKIYTFEITKEDNWVKKVKVPEGIYAVKARVKGAHEFASIRATQSDLPKEVKVTSDDAQAPIFTVLQGDWEFIEEQQWVCDYGDWTGEYIRGEIKKEDIPELVEKSVAAQDLEFMPDGEYEDYGEITTEDIEKADEDAGETIESGFKEEDIPKDKAEGMKPETITPEEDVKNTNNKIIPIAVGVIVVVAGAAVYMSKKKK